MASNQVGELVIKIGADIASLRRDVDQAKGIVGNFAAGFRSAVGAAGAALAAAGIGIGISAIAGSIREVLEEADRLDELSQQIGVSVETLSELEFAASRSGIALDELAGGFVRLNRAIVEAASDSEGRVAEAFARIGVSVVDTAGNIRDSEAVFRDLADAFRAMPAGAEEGATALELFGRSGANLIPLLNEGAAGIDRLAERARDLGLVIDGETATAASEFNDALDDITASMDAIWTVAAAKLAPALAEIATAFADWLAESGNLQWIGDQLAAVGEALIEFGRQTIREYQAIRDAVIATWDAIVAGAKGAANLVHEVFTVGIPNAIQGLAVAILEIPEYFRQAFNAAAAIVVDVMNAVVATVEAGVNKVIEALESMVNFAADISQDVIPRVDFGRVDLGEITAPELDPFESVAARQAELRNQIQTRTAEFEPLYPVTAEAVDLIEEGIGGLHDFMEASEVAAATVDETIGEGVARSAGRAAESVRSVTKEIETVTKTASDSFEQMKTGGDELTDLWADAGSAVQGFASSAADALFQMTSGVKADWKDMIQSLLADLFRLATNQIFQSLFSGGGATKSAGGGAGGILDLLLTFAGSLFGGGRAAGGPVSPGRWYMVGENGPEPFIPSSYGRIEPAALAGAGGGVTINNNGPPLRVDSIGQTERGIEIAVSAAVAQAEDRYRDSMRRGYGPWSEPLSATTQTRRRL